MDYLKFPIHCEKVQQDIRKFMDNFTPQMEMIEKHKFKRAAVLVAVFDYNGVPHIILTQRSSSLRLNAGQVALPGGKVDPNDKDVCETALREAEEEIGLDRNHIRVLGHLTPFYGPGMIVTPVVGYINDVKNVRIVPQESEVSNVFATPLELFVKIFSEKQPTKVIDYILWDASLYNDLISDTNVGEEYLGFYNALFSSRKNFKIWGLTYIIIVTVSVIILGEKYPSVKERCHDAILLILERIMQRKSAL